MNRRGFTLIEVMISVALLALVVVSLLVTQTGAVRLAGVHRDQTLAADVARARLAEALAIPADDLAPDGAQGDGAYRRYRWERTLHPTSTKGVTRVRVAVFWGAREEHELVVETLVTSAEIPF